MKFTEAQRRAIKGIRVDGDAVVIMINGGMHHSNDNARVLCRDLIAGLNAPPAVDEIEPTGGETSMINLFARYGVYAAIGALIGEAGWHPWDAWQWWAWFVSLTLLIEMHSTYSAKQATPPRG